MSAYCKAKHTNIGKNTKPKCFLAILICLPGLCDSCMILFPPPQDHFLLMALNVPYNMRRSVSAPVLSRPSMYLTISNLPLNTESLTFLSPLLLCLAILLSQLPSLGLLQELIKSTNHWGCPANSRPYNDGDYLFFSPLKSFLPQKPFLFFQSFRRESMRTYHDWSLVLNCVHIDACVQKN